MRNPAIIYNCSYNGLSIIQELSSKGIPCIALDNVFSIGAFSRYAKFKRCPNPLSDEHGFIDLLYDLCAKQLHKPVLFPTNDEWALITAKHKKRLQEVSFPCVADYSVTHTILSKDLFYQIGQQKGYMTPLTWPTEEFLHNTDIAFPIAAKAKYKAIPTAPGSSYINKFLKKNRLILISDRKELDGFFKKNEKLLPHLVFQEYIYGMSDCMYTVGIYADCQHNIKALFTGRKVRGYPADIGDNILGESHRVPESIIENTLKIVNDFAYEGIAEFEYKKNNKTGEFRLIEINPRPWSWIGITPYCGVNIPFIAYQSILGEEVKPQRSNTGDGEVKYIKIYQDFINCMFRYRYNYKPWHMSFSKWRKSLSASKLIIAEKNKGDWPILFASIPYVLAKLIYKKI